MDFNTKSCKYFSFEILLNVPNETNKISLELIIQTLMFISC